MRQWLMRNAFGRRLRRTNFTRDELAAMARNTSYLAPSALDLHDEEFAELPGPSLEAWGAKDIEFENGVAVRCSLAGRAFISLGERLSAPPWDGVSTVRLVAIQPFMVELAACPHLVRLRGLNLRGNRIGDSGAKALAASPYLTNLRELNLSTNNLTDDGLAALRAAPWFPQLESLELAGNRSAPVVASPLVRPKSL
jgi:hypothetical protein